MSDLPRIVLLAPRILYLLAIFWAAFNVVLPWAELNDIGFSTELGAADAVTNYVITRYVERALYDALFIAGLGLNAQILLAIWANTRGSSARTSDAPTRLSDAGTDEPR